MGYGPFSAEQEVVFTSGNQNLDPVTGLVVQVTPTGFDLTWDVLQNATGYNIVIRDITEGGTTASKSVAVTEYFWGINQSPDMPLVNGNTYGIKVQGLSP